MGVFALFRRKSKDAAEVSTEENGDNGESREATLTTGATPTPGAAAEAVTSEGTAAAAPPADEAPSDEVPAEAAAVEEAGPGATAEDAEAAAAEVLEIPKQQSAEEAADNEIGESVRK